jgi:hypothetical protein
MLTRWRHASRRDDRTSRPCAAARGGAHFRSMALSLWVVQFLAIALVGVTVVSSVSLAPTDRGGLVHSGSDQFSPATSGQDCSGQAPAYNKTYLVENSASGPSGTFQFGIRIDPAAVGKFAPSLANLETIYPNGTPIQTWIETNASGNSTDTLLWLRMYSVGAHLTQSIYLLACPSSVSEMSVDGPTGEAPEFSTPYASLDNGWRVFSLYDNFSGSTLKSMWTYNDGSPNGVGYPFYSVSNGLHMTTGGEHSTEAFIQSTATFAYPAVVDGYGTWSVKNGNGYDFAGMGQLTCSVPSCADVGNMTAFNAGIAGSVIPRGPSACSGASYSLTQWAYTGLYYYDPAHYDFGGLCEIATGPQTYTTSVLSPYRAYAQVNYATVNENLTVDNRTVSYPFVVPSPGHVMLVNGESGGVSNTSSPLFAGDTGPTSGTAMMYWIRERTYDPSIGIGLVNAPCYGNPPVYNATRVLTNTGSGATGAFQYNFTIDPATIPFLAADLSNLQFAYPNGSSVPSWIETNSTSTATNTLLWLKLNSITAGAKQSVDLLVCQSGDTDSFGENDPFSHGQMGVYGPSGEAPQLSVPKGQGGQSLHSLDQSGLYGEFDDGATVFGLYDNFSGGMFGQGVYPDSLWTISGGLTTGQVEENGFTGAFSIGTGQALYSVKSFTYPFAVDFYGSAWNGPQAFFGVGTGANTPHLNFSAFFIGDTENDGETGTVNSESAASTQWAGEPYAIWTVNSVSGSLASFQHNYSVVQSGSKVTTDVPASPEPVLLYGQEGSSNSVNDFTMTWVRERSYTTGVTISAPMTAASELTVSPVEGTSLGLSWTLGQNVGSNETVLEGKSCGTWTSRISLASTMAISDTVSGLTHNTTYCFAVQDWNSTGSLTSATASATTLTGLMTPDSGLYVVNRTLYTISIAWTLGVNITEGQSIVVLGPGETIVHTSSFNLTVLTYVATGLVPNTAYNLTLTVHNKTSTLYTWIGSTTLSNATSAPAGCGFIICLPAFSLSSNWPFIVLAGMLLLVAFAVGLSHRKHVAPAVGLGLLAIALLIVFAW